jgi:hypothetical protein
MKVALDDWMRALEARQLSELRFPEVTRALRALSSSYVERRIGLAGGAPLSSAGKRAAFALYYGPLHYLLVHSIVTALHGVAAVRGTIVDLGCGTGTAGAAWAGACDGRAAIVGVDRHPWAVAEAAWTYRALALPGRARQVDITRAPLIHGDAYLSAYTLNELPSAARERLKVTLFERASQGAAVLVVEPIAGFVAPWWEDWKREVLAAGGRADEWRIPIEAPAVVAKLARAAGLTLRALTARSLWMRR